MAHNYLTVPKYITNYAAKKAVQRFRDYSRRFRLDYGRLVHNLSEVDLYLQTNELWINLADQDLTS